MSSIMVLLDQDICFLGKYIGIGNCLGTGTWMISVETAAFLVSAVPVVVDSEASEFCSSRSKGGFSGLSSISGLGSSSCIYSGMATNSQA